MGSRYPVKSRSYKGHPACTFQWEKNNNDVFHVLVSKYLQSLYFMLFILMKAMPRCTLTPNTTTKLHILVTKMVKTLDFGDF